MKKKVCFVLIVIVLSLCCLGMNSQATPKKSYVESLFTLGEIASVEINMPDSTWQAIIEHARDKQYHVCSVTINGA